MILIHVVQRAADVGCSSLVRDVAQEAGTLRELDPARNLKLQDAISRFMKYVNDREGD